MKYLALLFAIAACAEEPASPVAQQRAAELEHHAEAAMSAACNGGDPHACYQLRQAAAAHLSRPQQPETRCVGFGYWWWC